MPTLREIREKHYISRNKLAKAADVSESTIIRMEGGKKTTEEAASKILSALSEMIKEEIKDVEGLNIYNPMKDRAYPTKPEEPAAQGQTHSAHNLRIEPL